MRGLFKFIVFFIILGGLSSGILIKVKSNNATYLLNGQEEILKEEVFKEEQIVKEEEIEADKVKAEVEEKKKEYIKISPEEVYIPILMYHSISEGESTNSLIVPKYQFEEQMSWLKEEGFTPMLMDDVMEALEIGQVPKRPVAITFDDGYTDNYMNAYKILTDKNMKATFFIITDNTDVDSFYMNSDMLKELANNGMGIENHTSKHLELNRLSREDKVAIIKEAKDFLKENIGVDSKYLCYPVGRYDDETIEVAKELGIEGAVTTEGGFSNITNGELELKRIRIAPMGIEDFKGIFESFMVEI